MLGKTGPLSRPSAAVAVMLAFGAGAFAALFALQRGAPNGGFEAQPAEPALAGPSAALATSEDRSTEATAEEVPPGLRIVQGEAAAFVPRTWSALAETTAGPAIVRPVQKLRVEAPSATRHRATAAEAAAISSSRPPGSTKPAVAEGDWLGAVGLVNTVYAAEVDWLDPERAPELLELGFPGGEYSDLVLVVDDMPMPRIGVEYLMFITVSDEWATPAYVQFAIQGGRTAPHMHNEMGIGSDLLNLPIAAVAERAQQYTFRNNNIR